MIELQSAVVYLGKSRMDVYVKDGEGVLRKIEISWFAKTHTDTPPETWWESVVAEVEYQRAAELEKRTGRTLF